MNPSLLLPFSHAKLRRRTRVLLLMGTGQLLLFLVTAVQNFYWGLHTILLKVHANSELHKAHPHLTTTLPTSAGTYSTGTQGDLLYQPSSLSNFLLFYTTSEVNILSVVFIFLLSLYLHLAINKLQPGREFSQGLSRALSLIGLVTLLMYTAEMAFNVYLTQLFETQTHHQFFLTTAGPSLLYVVFGSIMLLAASFFELGSQLQHDADLTI